MRPPAKREPAHTPAAPVAGEAASQQHLTPKSTAAAALGGSEWAAEDGGLGQVTSPGGVLCFEIRNRTETFGKTVSNAVTVLRSVTKMETSGATGPPDSNGRAAGEVVTPPGGHPGTKPC